MRIIFAKNLGFCFGVRRALEFSEKSLKEDPKPVQFLGEIVHNEKVISEIKKKGGKFISSPKQAKSGTLIIRAHGMPPFIPAKKLKIRDLTCPLVKKTQINARTLFKNSYKVIIIGDKNHPEVKGIKGYTENKAIIVENKLQAKRLKKFGKIGVVAQTTQSLDKVNEILEILRKKAKEFKWLNTLCPEVLSRQKELSQILKKVDGILIIGSRSSANTKCLAEIAKKSKKPVHWINSSEELEGKRFKNFSTLGVVSGTSTPNWVIKEIVSKLNSCFKK